MLRRCGRLVLGGPPSAIRYASSTTRTPKSILKGSEETKLHHDGPEDGAKTPRRSRKRSDEKEVDEANSSAPTESLDDLSVSPEDSTKRTTKQRAKQPAIPSRLLATSPSEHQDLPTFLDYASRTDLNPASTVYVGTHYEYTVANTLKAFRSSVVRTGRSNDLGIDLIGHWSLPKRTKDNPLRILIQCKAVKPGPAMVRELEGAYVGAPSGWHGPEVIALLVASHGATKGVREAMQRSRWPMGFMQITREGDAKQFMWNAVAAQAGLEGLGVAVKYGAGKDANDDSPLGATIALTWQGKLI